MTITSVFSKLVERARPCWRALGIVRPEGKLRVTLQYADRSVVHINDLNLIVKTGKIRLLKALYAGVSAPGITQLRVGNGGSIDPEGLFPKQVDQTLTNLFNTVLSVPVTYSLDLEYPSVTFIADIDPEQCANIQLTEAGLFFGDGEMFNIKTFPGIPKTQDFSIHFEWTIRIN